ncbi:MAG TPA: hypothetical protein VNT30_23615 [Stellaceae bacterium]|nr:hypothetical protein [Stellaceae bacterium]
MTAGIVKTRMSPDQERAGGLRFEALKSHPRSGWADDARRIAEGDDDGLVLGGFGNDGDDALAW